MFSRAAPIQFRTQRDTIAQYYEPDEQPEPEQDTVDVPVFELNGFLWVHVPGEKHDQLLATCWTNPCVCGPVVNGRLQANLPEFYVWFDRGGVRCKWEPGRTFRHCEAVRFRKE